MFNIFLNSQIFKVSKEYKQENENDIYYIK